MVETWSEECKDITKYETDVLTLDVKILQSYAEQAAWLV